MQKKIKNFRDLNIWKKGIEIVKELKYLNEDNKKIMLEKIDHESRMIVNLIKRLN
jgi:flagellar biosynthesis/type III secretory pathway chaperone